MRKTYLFLTALLLQFLSVGVFAQTSSALVAEYGDPLITDPAQLSSNASDQDEGQHIEYLIDGDASTFWHSDWHGNVTDPHYIQAELLEPVTSGNIIVFLQRRNIADGAGHLKKAKLTGSADGETWEDLADIEFDNATASAEVLSQVIPVNGEYYFFRLTNMNTNPIYFHAAEFELYNPTDAMIVRGELMNIFVGYEELYWGGLEAMNIGTGFGQYTDTETAEKFLDILDKIYNFLENPEAEGFPTQEEAKAMGAELEVLYAKFKESEVLYRLPADGYYRIIANLEYKYTIDTGEKDENNMPITTTEYATKGMFCGLNYNAGWGDLQEDRANFIWKLTQTGDSIDMYNIGMEARFSQFGATVKMSEESDKHVIFDYAGNEDGRDIVYIRAATGTRNGSEYLHQLNHSRGTQKEDQNLCVWRGTFDMGMPYDSDKGTSEWYLEPVDEAEAMRLLEEFGPIKNHDLLVEQNNALREEVKSALITAKDMIPEALITSADQMTSPFSQNDLGATDGGNLSDGVLIDNNPDTYWHSAWSVGDVEQGSHYIQLSGMEKMVGNTTIYVLRRKTDSNHPTEFTLRGSNDPEADDADWTDITVQTLGNATSGAAFTTDIFDAGETPYSYVRVYATKSGFWHSGELQIYHMNDNPNSQFAAMGELGIALEDLYNENCNTADEDITIEMYEALKNAFDAFKGGVVDPAELRAALAKFANGASVYEEGTNPGFWKDATAVNAYQSLYDEVSEYDKAGKYTKTQIGKYVAALELAYNNILASANRIEAGKWYRIQFPTEDMFTKYGWNRGNIDGDDVNSVILGNYMAIGMGEDLTEEGLGYDYYPVEADDMREGMGMYALDDETIGENKDGSIFQFVPVQTDIDNLDNFKELVAGSRLVLGMTNTYTVGDPLITKASQLSSNASDSEEGKYIENLIDGDASTFWHSDWHGAVSVPHYLQVALDTPVSGAIQMTMTRRQGAGNGDVIRMFLTASNDGEQWNNIGYVELPFTTSGETVSSKPIELGGSYSKLRFILTQRRGDDTEYDPFGEKCTYFHASEVQLNSVTYDSEFTASAKALNETLAAKNAVVMKDITTEDYNELATAYEAARKEINGGAYPIVPAIGNTTRYALQNKATGLFVYVTGKNTNDVTLRLTPTLYRQQPLGCGTNLLKANNIDGTFCTYMHVQKNNHRFCSWESNNLGSNSGLLIEEVEPSDQTEFSFTKNVKTGEINTICSTVALTNNGEGTAYSVAGTYSDADGNEFLALSEIQQIEPGQPFIYIYGNLEDWVEETEEEPTENIPMEFALNSEKIVTEAATENGLVGTLVPTTVPAGNILFTNNTTTCVENQEGQSLSYGKAYLDINACPVINEDDEYTLSILISESAADADGIQEALANISKTGNIYTTDGKLVRTNATLNDMKRLGQGTYILNGVKVFVK